jgi:4-amino-4-deoxy-L-arabinose transferase-like glycosyltransferase
MIPRPGPVATGERGLSKSWEAAILVLITLLAAALRFYRLTEVPPGLHFDEAFKAVTARSLLEGAPPKLFFESDMGEEPVAMYLVTVALGLVGQEPWAVRLPSAIIGTLTVPLAWWLGREFFRLAWAGGLSGARRTEETALPETLSGQGGSRLQEQVVGLGTALVLSIMYWHLSFSRIGMEPILVPFFATLAFAAMAHGLNLGGRGKRATLSLALAGLALGGSVYTYKAGYLVPVIAALFAGYAAVVERGFLRRQGRGLLLMALVALVVAMPLGIYFAIHPANFLQRPMSVALTGGATEDEGTLGGPWQALADNLPRVLGMFFLQGDTNPRSNLPGRPALDPFLALLLLAGLIKALTGFRRPAFALSLLWLVVMILPTLLTEHAPHFGRAIGVTPALALLCGLGGWWLVFGIGGWKPLQSRIRYARQAIAAVLVVGLILAGASTAWAYFHTWARSPDLFYAYDVGLVHVAKYINTLSPDEDIYLTPTAHDHYTLEFLVNRPFASFDGRDGLPLPPPDRAATIIVLLGEDGTTLPFLQRVDPDGEITWTLADDYDRPYAAAYHLPANSSAPPPDHPADAILGGAVRLLGYSLDAEKVAAGSTLYLTLYWQSLAPLEHDYTVFTHLLGATNPTTNGPVWAGHDGQPDGGHYRTSVWQPGQIVLDVHPIWIPPDTPSGVYQLEAGLYLLETRARLPATDGGGSPLPADAVLLGAVEVGD